MSCQPVRVLICGSTFAQLYITALLAEPTRYQLVGILARGSDRSRQLAERHQLPLFITVADIPSDIDLACVVLRAGVLGGNGTTLTKQLLARGISVLQEQPLHQQEVTECLRCARQHGVRFQVVDHYLQLDNVRRFISAARSILHEQPGQWIDAACANQVLFPLLHMLGEIAPLSVAWQISCVSNDPAQPLQILQGYLGKVPLTLRIWNQVDPDDPDNHLPLLQQLNLGVAGGTLMLQDTHGELGWLPRLHIPKEVRQAFDFGASAAASLMEDSVLNLSAPTLSIRNQLMRHWPAAIAREVGHFLMLADDELVSRKRAQLLLQTCQRWQQTTSALGYPMIKSGQQYHYLPLNVLKTAVERVNTEPTLKVPLSSLSGELRLAVEAASPLIREVTLSQTQQSVSRLDENITARYLNKLIASLVCQRARNQHRLRVLEIGVGTDATMDAVLAQCRDEGVRVNYHFSDQSTFFIEKVRERYRHHAMQFSLVDINCSFTEQGMPAASKDVVICSGGLNNAQEILRVLHELRGLLAPGGWLLFSEMTVGYDETHMSQGFIKPESHDDRQSTRERFFSIAQWKDALWRVGFVTVWVLPEEDHPLARFGQRLFFAATPESPHSLQN
ncbi:TPA_asm: methyltransferase domain-containing protein [Salmonella enterica]|nr:methyltransferase domain-containing protein [Salmonella enterica]EBQ2130336.1 methyltransferase domain-containing protein [Salmonella enterica]EJI1747254.1 Gfo/Idh/MocA family oxidoreductase [Salmonella enterica]HAC8238615.1 methyltransferase domain-containing protein [Salmonella enterica]HAC8272186.1 methyltransferase domain-containing protein [Salmonella enterica]